MVEISSHCEYKYSHYIDSFNEVYISPFSKSWDMCADDFHVFLIFISLEIVLTVRSGTYRDGHKINPSVGISPTFSHCDRP